MSKKRKESIRALLKAIETGDEKAIAVVSSHKYIQHNPETHEGSEGEILSNVVDEDRSSIA